MLDASPIKGRTLSESQAVTSTDAVALTPEMLQALSAVLQGGKHLLNALRWLGVEPDSLETQFDALSYDEWPSPWAYDVWCAWHACRIVLRRAGWPVEEIAIDHRTHWRTSAHFPVYGESSA